MQIARSGLESATVADLGIRAASEAIAKRPAAINVDSYCDPPEPGEVLQIERTGHPGSLFAYVWRSARNIGFYDLIAFEDDRDKRETGSMVAMLRPCTWEGISLFLSRIGLLICNVQIERFSAEIRVLEELRLMAVAA
jgi:hypothetical protein